MSENKKRLHIVGTGIYLPGRPITNKEFVEGKTFYKYDGEGNRLGEGFSISEDKVVRMTGGGEAGEHPERGVAVRYRAVEHETPAYMGLRAAVDAVESCGRDPRKFVEGLKRIVVGTVSQDQNYGSAACRIQEGLERHYGVRIKDCSSLDVTAACAGAVYAMESAYQYFAENPGNQLVVAAENVLGMWQEDDQDSFLFGAGAAAAACEEADDGRGIHAVYTSTDTFEGKGDWITRDKNRFGRMPFGGEVLKHGTNAMIDSTRMAMEKAKWETLDRLVPHQANGRMISRVEKKAKREFGADTYWCISRMANVSSVTNLIGLHWALQEGFVKKGHKVGIPAVGAGLAKGAVVTQF